MSKIETGNRIMLEYGKIPPQNIEIEEVILGAILLTGKCESVADFLTPESFYKDAHQKIYEAILQIYKDNEKIDILTATEQLKKNGELEDIGGAFYISQLTNKVTSNANIETHAKIVYQKYVARELIRLFGDYTVKLFDESEDVTDIMSKIQDDIFDLTKIDKNIAITISESIDNVMNIIKKNKEGNRELTGMATGFTYFDRFSNGLQKGDLMIIAGETSQGKTSIALCILNNISKSGHSGAIISYEMTNNQLTAKLMAQESDINSKAILKEKLEGADIYKLTEKTRDLSQVKIYLTENINANLDSILKAIKSLKINLGIDLIIIDYLQLISAGKRGVNKEEELADISRSLKNIAKSLDINIILISQLSRDKYHPKPQLNRLRGSGQIEEASDIVMFVYRPEYYTKEHLDFTDVSGNPIEALGKAHIIVAKGRTIGTTDFVLNFKKETQKFTNYSEEIQSKQAIKEDAF